MDASHLVLLPYRGLYTVRRTGQRQARRWYRWGALTLALVVPALVFAFRAPGGHTPTGAPNPVTPPMATLSQPPGPASVTDRGIVQPQPLGPGPQPTNTGLSEAHGAAPANLKQAPHRGRKASSSVEVLCYRVDDRVYTQGRLIRSSGSAEAGRGPVGSNQFSAVASFASSTARP